MSLATSEPVETKFLARFEHVCAALRRFQIRKGLCWTLVAAALGLALLAAADFVWELPWNGRLAGLIGWAIATLAVVWSQVVAPMRWWTEPRTAVEIESRFPQLGQRIRTVVQYAGLSEELLHTEGAAPSLVDALERETDIRVQPLPLDRIVPWPKVWAVAALVAVPVLFLLISTARNAEWRIALLRAFLSRRPYTTLSVAPGNLLVDQGGSVPIAVELHGRLKRDVVLYTRPAGESEAGWKAVPLDAPDRSPNSRRETKLERVEKPLDYRVTAGPSSSPSYRVDVRYPLVLTSFDVAIAPPAYTGVKPSTVKGGNLRVIEGTDATFQIAFDAPPSEASLVMTDPSVHPGKTKAPPVPIVVPLKLSGALFTAGLKLTKGLDYQIEARTADGRVTPKIRYKIEVLEDRPPRVAFEQPDEALEVHPLAEVLNRIRVGDDFGLTKAGIVFQFNNGDEQTLIADDFKAGPTAKNRTSAALQETLLLEKLAASPTDSLTYYAFAEDNFPAGARRTETDMRYVDIRPFKREYKLAESGSGMEGEGELTSLGELIARQRFNLNRAKRLAKHKPGDRAFADDPLKIAGFEETLLGLTRELMQGIEGIVGQRIEPFHAAEESMLAAIGALDHGQNERAPGHMGDALRHLIEARNSVRILIGQDPATAQAMRSYDRTQAQKIRKPKKDQEEAEEIAEEIEQVAREEDFVYASLSAVMMEQQAADGKPREDPATAEEKDAETKMDPAKDKDEAKKAEKSPKGAKGSKGSQGSKGQGKGQDGAKADPNDENDSGGEPKKDKRREASEKQEQIADKLRELEEKLKKLEVASDLAKARMANAAETAEKASGALARGNTSEATETAKAAAAKLHELARQVKGELAREVATELAMARDLADELADREAELGETPGDTPGSGSDPGDKEGKDAPGKGAPVKGGRGKGGRGGLGELTEAERLERLEEAAKTLEHWLKDASLSAEGESADRIRELIEDRDATRVVERMQRIGALYLAGQKPDARRDASELARSLEILARQLDVLYRGIIAPELANLVDLDKRVAELMEKLKGLEPGDATAEWRRMAEALVRDLEKAGLTTIARELADVLAGGTDAVHNGPAAYATALTSISVFLQGKIQDLVLKDMVSSREEATPPAFKELVERYYEVLSKNGGSQ